MIVRLGYHGQLYDLSDGSLSDEPIGVIETTGEEIYSAEQLLTDLGELGVGFSIEVIVTGFTDDDVKVMM